jgi:hypothetical protein
MEGIPRDSVFFVIGSNQLQSNKLAGLRVLAAKYPAVRAGSELLLSHVALRLAGHEVQTVINEKVPVKILKLASRLAQRLRSAVRSALNATAQKIPINTMNLIESETRKFLRETNRGGSSGKSLVQARMKSWGCWTRVSTKGGRCGPLRITRYLPVQTPQ